MATINLLHWNIETLSLRKITVGNGAQIINYIARVAAHVNANMISIIEVKAGGAAMLSANLLPAIQFAKANANAWNTVISAVTPNGEVYYLMWETGNNFTSLPSAAPGGPNPNQGPFIHNLNPPPPALRFPSPNTPSGGRRPYTVTFRTTDTNNTFSVIAYHVMFGFFTAAGVQNAGRLRSIQQVDDGTGNLVNMAATVVAGDFNVDFINNRIAYNNLIANVGVPVLNPPPPPAPVQRAALTTLVNQTPPGGFPNSLAYRVNAYDNIFPRNAATANAAVTDLLVASATLAGVAGFLVPVMTNFNRAFVRNQALLNNAPPPQDLEDAWHIVRDQVSNHLPVSVALTI